MTEEKNQDSTRPTDGEMVPGVYRCPVCGRAFATHDELLNHEKTHLGEQVGKTGTDDSAAAKNAGMLSDRGNETVPWGEERRGWTTGTGDREGGEGVGRDTPGGRDPGFSSD